MKIVVELDENKIINVTYEEVELDEDKAQYRYTGGMHGEYHPTKKQPSRAAHKDAAKFHERESKIYSKALGEKGADKDYVNRAIDFHTNAASHHRNMASSMKEEVDVSGVVETLVKHLPMVKKAKAAYKKLEQKESQKYKNQQLERLHKEAKNAGFKLVKL